MLEVFIFDENMEKPNEAIRFLADGDFSRK